MINSVKHLREKENMQNPVKYSGDKAWIQTYTGKKFFPLSPQIEDIDIIDIAHALSNICRFTGHSQKFYCVTPDTKILTSELVWKKAGDLSMFEGLVGFDENTGEDGVKSNNRKMRRKMRHSYVLNNGIIKRHVYALHLSDGTVLKSSDEHPWLICSKISRNQRWETTKEIVEAINDKKQRFMLRFTHPWPDLHNTNSNKENYTLGYLSGIFDGEGTINCDRRGFIISIAQNPGLVLNKIKEYLSHYGFKHYEYVAKDKKCHNIQLGGDWSEKLRFLGTVRPIRLLEKYKTHLTNSDWRKEFNSIDMLSISKIEDLGMQDVVALETSSRTYFAEGFGAHNSVAEHSVLVSYICDKQDALYGLLHDGSEFALTDMASPLKNSGQFENYRNYEKILQQCIYQKYGLFDPEPQSVKEADLVVLATEARDLLSPLHPEWIMSAKPLPFKIAALPPEQAKQLFLDRFTELTGIII